MRELAVQAANGSNSATDRAALDVEFEALKAEVERIVDNTQWNGSNLLNGLGAVAFQVGANASQTISITLADFQTANGDEATGPLGDVDVDGDGDLTDSTSGVASLDLTTASNHTAVLNATAIAGFWTLCYKPSGGVWTTLTAPFMATPTPSPAHLSDDLFVLDGADAAR